MTQPVIQLARDTTGGMTEITMSRPSNFHSHMRNGSLREAIAYLTLFPWKYLLVMPNTGPIRTVDEMLEYLRAIEALRDEFGLQTIIIPTVYFTSSLTTADIERLARLDLPCAVKYYPPEQGATTGSGIGMPLHQGTEILRAMERNGVRLLGHFESMKDDSGNLLPEQWREDYFMENHFPHLRNGYPNLKITIEHATTRAAIKRVLEDPSGRTTCTITPQAMLLAEDDVKKRTWAVHAKCMPCAKTPGDRDAVRTFALSGDFRAYLGDDTAPHPSKMKEDVTFEKAANGCFLPHSPAIYAMMAEMGGTLTPEFVRFTSFNGPIAWGLEPPGADDLITLRRTGDDIPPPVHIPGTSDVVIPFGWAPGKPDELHPGFRVDGMKW